MENYGFIGLGNIGKMLLNRFKDIGIHDANIYASNSNETNQEVIKNSDIIYLCIRPQDLQNVYAMLKHNLENKLLISTIAAIETQSYYGVLGNIQLIRIIPSMTNAIGGPILFCPGKYTSTHNINKTKSDLSKIANVYKIEEEHIDEYNHLASCSPAIITEFLREYLDSIIETGINPQLGKEILLDASSSTLNILKQDKGFDLIDRVCTKQGISKVGVNLLRQGNSITDISQSLLKRIKEVKQSYG